MRDETTWPIPRALGAAVTIAVVLSGCVSDPFRQSVTLFGSATSASVTAEDARLVAVGAEEDARIRAALAATPTDLRIDAGCAATLALQTSGIGSGTAPIQCFLTDTHGSRIATAADFGHIRALGTALTHYSDMLIQLAADSSADEATFSTAVLNLGSAVGNMDDAVRAASGAPAATGHDALNGVAGVVASAGKLFLSAARGRALRRIIVATDPVVQRASVLLAQTDDRLRLYDLSGLAPDLLAAQGAVSDTIGRHGSTADIRAAQDTLYAKLAAYNQAAAQPGRYAAIGAAHAKLAVAARRGATLSEMAAAIEAVLDLAGQVGVLAKPQGAAS
jgi:hypothetical protein